MQIASVPPKTFTGLAGSKITYLDVCNLKFEKSGRRSYFTSNYASSYTATLLPTSAPATNIWRAGSYNATATNTSFLAEYERQKLSYGHRSQRQQQAVNTTCASVRYARILAPWRRNGPSKQSSTSKTLNSQESRFCLAHITAKNLLKYRSRNKNLLLSDIGLCEFSQPRLPAPFNLINQSRRILRFAFTLAQSQDDSRLRRLLRNERADESDLWKTYLDMVERGVHKKIEDKIFRVFMKRIIAKEHGEDAVEKLLRLRNDMKKCNYHICESDDILLIKAYLKIDKLEQAREILDQIVRGKPQKMSRIEPPLNESLIGIIQAYVKAGKFEEMASLIEMMNSKFSTNKQQKNFIKMVLLDKIEINSIACFNKLIDRSLVDVSLAKETLNKLISSSRISEAFELFKQMEASEMPLDYNECQIFIWKLIEKEELDKVAQLLDRYKRAKRILDPDIYQSVFDMYVRASNFKKAHDLIEDVLNEGHNPKMEYFVQVMKGYGKLGEFNSALELWNRMKAAAPFLEASKHSNLLMDVYQATFDKYILASDFNKAHDLTDKMLNAGHLPKVKYFYQIIKGYAKLGNVNSALQICKSMKYNGIKPSFEVYASLIQLFCKVNDIESMERVYSRMIEEDIYPDFIVYNILISGYCTHHDLEKAFKVCRKMIEAGYQPDSYTYNSLISLFANRGDSLGATMLFNEMRSYGIKENAYTYTSLIDAYAKASDLKGAEKIFKDMKNSGIQPQLHTYNVLLNAYTKVKDLEKVESFYDEMVKNRLHLNSYSYSCLMEAMCSKKSLTSAESLLRSIKKSDRPGASTYNVLMHAYSRIGKLERAHELFEEMVSSNIKPTLITYAILIDGNSRAGNLRVARSLLSELIERSWIESSSSRTLSSLLKKDEEPDDGVDETKISDKKIIPHAYIFTPIMNAYAKEGRSKAATKIFHEMLIYGIQPNEVTYTILMDGYRNCGDYEAVWEVWKILRRDLMKSKPSNSFPLKTLAEPKVTMKKKRKTKKSTKNNADSIKIRKEMDEQRHIIGSPTIKSLRTNRLIRPTCQIVSILIDALRCAQRYDLICQEWKKLESEGYSFDCTNYNQYAQTLIFMGKILEASEFVNKHLLKGWNRNIALWGLNGEEREKQKTSILTEISGIYPQRKTLRMLNNAFQDIKSGRGVLVDGQLKYVDNSVTTNHSIIDFQKMYPELVFIAKMSAGYQKWVLKIEQQQQ